ncbi:hypothetical protein GIB67_040512 [Kingdonia uniflora]|uniref:DCD domain-containing protein n=1 Tax=Kingdonia uniflora TaxID=39325 RepID=A0A7J7L5H0_9MAGN|nr:hypothetical protein GIB67_040512 [Kingdonia uniflora]
MEKLTVKAKGKGKAANSSMKIVVKDDVAENKTITTISNDDTKAAQSEIKKYIGNSPATIEKSRKRKRNKKLEKRLDSIAIDKPSSSEGDKGLKKVDGMGMIFMCNSKTKQDCYRYKVLGLPASKKELVTKIYQGMRLFLYDTDLKLLYGIYKASEPGGYNIEPKAFNSAFPSQVRFKVFEDCLPLPEEKFKAAIEDNYFGRSKFDCKLKTEQVKNLCKLFSATTKNRSSEQVRRAPISESRAVQERNGDRSRGRRDGVRRREVGGDRDRWQGRDGFRRPPLGVRRDRIRLEGPRRYRRELSPSPPRLHRPLSPRKYVRREVSPSSPLRLRLPPPLPPTNYSFQRPLEDVDILRRELHARTLMELERRRREEDIAALRERDSYNVYREPLPGLHESLYLPVAPQPNYQALQPSYLAPQPSYQIPPSSLFRY